MKTRDSSIISNRAAVILLLLLFLLIGLPLLMVLSELTKPGDIALNKLLLDSQLIKTSFNSLKLGFFVVLLSTVISLPLSFILGRTALGKRGLIDVFLMIPMMTPPYISSMGWILFMQNNGILVRFFPALKGVSKGFFSFYGLVLIMTFHVFPFMLSLLKDALLRQPYSIDEAGKIYGAGYFKRLRKITLPLMTSNYAVAAFLVFVKTLSEYGTPATFGTRIKFQVFTTEIHKYASIAPISFRNASALSLILILICLLLWLLQNYVFRRTSYALISGKASKRSLSNNKTGNIIGGIFLLLVMVVSIGIPYISIIITSLLKLRGRPIEISNMTLDHYKTILLESPKAQGALMNSLKLALLAGIIVTIIGLLAALVAWTYGNKHGQSPLQKSVEGISLLPTMLPSVVMVIGIMLLYNKIYNILPIYNTNYMVLIAYVILYIPFSFQNIQGSLTGIGKSLIEAGRVNGGKNLYILRTVIMPLIVRGILAGFILTFVTSFRELVASSLLQAPGKLTVSTYIMREFEQGDVSSGMAMAVICVILNLVLMLLLNIFILREKKR